MTFQYMFNWKFVFPSILVPWATIKVLRYHTKYVPLQAMIHNCLYVFHLQSLYSIIIITGRRLHWKHSDAIFIVSFKIILITYRRYRQPSCIKKEHCVCEIAALRNAVVKWKGSRRNALGMVGVNVRNTKHVGDAGRTIFSQHHRAGIM